MRARTSAPAAIPAISSAATLAELEAGTRPSLRRVLNATGVLIHTNLGRAPLAQAALDRVAEVGGGYSNLEYDLDAGARGSRQDHLSALLQRLTGAEASLVVNNNAAAVMLALAALAEGREVLVSRGELIEIGDGFRIPDVLTRSGARLVEVGTTNRTRVADYERALGPETAVILRVHQSNFRVVGFTEQPALSALAEVAQSAGLPLVDDLGSGALSPIGDESTPAASLAAGADLVCFSGDKLLGGPQAGILVGSAELIEQLRRHPLQRALRADKLTLAALEGTLALALDPERARGEIPMLRMLAEPAASVRERAVRLAGLLDGEVEETVARVGGGALPLEELPSFACAIEESLFDPLRRGRAARRRDRARRPAPARRARAGRRRDRRGRGGRHRCPRPMSRPSLAARLRAGESLVGAWCSLPGPGPAELLAAGGVDYVVLDLQHGLLAERDLPLLFPAIEAHGAAPVVRLRSNDGVEIGRVLDLGAEGIIVPNVDSAEEARSAVLSTLYPPRGTRGFGPVRAALTLGHDALEDIAVIAQVESRAALDCVEELARVEGLAALYVGPWDLSVSLGLPVPPDTEGDELAAALSRVRAAADAVGLPAGVHSIRAPEAGRFAAAGWRLVNVVDDVTALRDAVASGHALVRP